MKKIINIINLDCPNCAKELEEEILKVEDIISANVDFINQKIHLNYNNEKALENVIYLCNHFEEVKVVENKKKTLSFSKDIILLCISFLLFLIAVLLDNVIKIDSGVITIIIYLTSYLLSGYIVIINTFKNIIKGKIFDENFLMFIASLGAIIIGELEEGVTVMILYQLGELLQSIAVYSSRNDIAKLMDLQSDEANLIKDYKLIKISSKELEVDDIIQINKGDKIPVDCLLLDDGIFDVKSLTGESLPKEIEKNNEVLSGYINLGNSITAKVIRKYDDSAVQKILNIVETATSNKAKSEKFITKFAKFYTPIVVAIAFVIGVIVPLVISLFDGLWLTNFQEFIYRALILLVISCPCALVISVPLTYFGGIGASAKHGILVKGAINLDELCSSSIIAFDKTGTLTKGEFKIIKHVGDNKMFQYAAALEMHSHHPISDAFKDIKTNLIAVDVEEIVGKGIIGNINDKECVIGNIKLMIEKNIKVPNIDTNSVVLYVSYDNQYLGYFEIDDVIKDEASYVINELKHLGIHKTIILSGDHKVRVENVSKELGIDETYSELLPTQKLEVAKNIKREGKLIYVGDGINDTLVMTEANISISMGKLGSDSAIEISDIVLVSDNLKEIATAIKISKKTHVIVLQNIIFSIVMKVLFMILGIFDIIPLYLAIFADVGVMLIAVINSLRVKVRIK